MSMNTRVLILITIIAFAVASLRFVPSLAISRGVTDFAAGIALGLLIGLGVTWFAERGGT
jgi:hypothetical protein